MLKTSFLSQESYEYKEFKHFLPRNQKKLLGAKARFATDIFQQNYEFTTKSNYSDVYLKNLNCMYCLEHIPYNTDLILPKPKNLNDWLVLFYEQTTTAFKVSNENRHRIKIRGNGQKIMGLDEPLICDVAFMSLRLTFLGDVDGWVVT